MEGSVKDIIVIGAGASGIMAAVAAAANGAAVRVLEHMDRPGKKLLSTGNGRCNLTNEYMDEKCYLNDGVDIVMQVLDKFNQYDVIKFFNSIGILTKVRRGYSGDSGKEGYVYPNSDQASTVLNALMRETERLGVEFTYGVDVDGIECIESGEMRFRVHCRLKDGGEEVHRADSLILATGSRAAPATGSDGSGYELARRLGHRIIKPLPALVPLVSSERFCRELAGVRCDALVRMHVGKCCGELLGQECGELQFTDYGISGIPVFQLSHGAVALLDCGKKIHAVIDLLPKIDKAEIFSHWKYMRESHGDMGVVDYMSGMLNSKLAAVVCKRLGIDGKMRLNGMDEHDVCIVADAVKSFDMEITGFKSYDRAQVCSGGVALGQINPDTMESRLCGGLYLAGELLDVDGICGGYNLQWAWSSGHLAGMCASGAAV